MISIITPVYNGGKFILNNIESIKKLSELSIEFEHIIVDGGSIDDTIKIIKQYPHLNLIHQKDNTGMYGAIDLGFKQAKGSYITWINCDDIIIPDAFAEMYKYAQKYNYHFVCSDGYFFNEHNQVISTIKGTSFVKYFLKRGLFPFLQPSSLYKRDFYFQVSGLNYNKFRICGDLDLFFRMALCKEATFGYLPLETTKFLKYGDSLGDRNTELAIKEKQQSNIPQIGFVDLFLFRICKLLRI